MNLQRDKSDCIKQQAFLLRLMLSDHGCIIYSFSLHL